MGATVRVEAWPELMSRDLAAAYLSCSPRKLDDLQRAGHVIPLRSHAGKRFSRKELDSYISRLPEWDDGK